MKIKIIFLSLIFILINLIVSFPVFAVTMTCGHGNINTNFIDKVDGHEGFEDIFTQRLFIADEVFHVLIENSGDNKLELEKITENIRNRDYLAYMGYNSIECRLYSISGNKGLIVCGDIRYDYNSLELMAMKRELTGKVREIAAKIFKDEMSRSEKVKAAHDYIINNTSYDESPNAPPLSHYAYGCLLKGKAVCDGYASAFLMLLKEAEIGSIIVSGTSDGENHAWNIVNIDGKNYHIDTTWDDPVSSSGRDILSYDFYRLTDEEILKTHSFDREKYPECSEKYVQEEPLETEIKRIKIKPYNEAIEFNLDTLIKFFEADRKSFYIFILAAALIMLEIKNIFSIIFFE